MYHRPPSRSYYKGLQSNLPRRRLRRHARMSIFSYRDIPDEQDRQQKSRVEAIVWVPTILHSLRGHHHKRKRAGGEEGFLLLKVLMSFLHEQNASICAFVRGVLCTHLYLQGDFAVGAFWRDQVRLTEKMKHNPCHHHLITPSCPCVYVRYVS
jgi:hypothetical protein